MANFDINTRADQVKRRAVPVSSGTFETGRWLSIDANGYAAKPAHGDTNVYICILGNELRPDSIASSSVTVAYGDNVFTLNTYGAYDTITTGNALMVNSLGDLVVTTTLASAVAWAENTKNLGVTGLKIRTVR